MEHDVFRLNIPVQYSIDMEILETHQNTCYKELLRKVRVLVRDKLTGLFFSEAMVHRHLIPEVAAREKIHYKVEVFTILERTDHVY